MNQNFYVSPNMVVEVMSRLNPSVHENDECDWVETVDELEDAVNDDTTYISTGGLAIVVDHDNTEFTEFFVDLRLVYEFMAREGLL